MQQIAHTSIDEQGESRVHLVFKTHLDAGFTELAEAVKRRYYTEYFPQAIATARYLRERSGSERFIWTTGSWILYEYLEQASSRERALMEQAIVQGDIAWHGLAFTTHSELMDASLFAYSLSLSHELDHRFGKTTIADKMTDVPGHTRAIVPLLAQAGIQFLHLGVNPASTAPDVPPLFVWQDLATGTDVIVMYQPGSYGDLTLVPGSPAALAFAHTLDNRGPQSAEQALQAFAHLREQMPGMKVIASTLDAFARDILPLKHQLPVVTGELGDSWIHGVGSDPLKVAQYRALSRLRCRWLANGSIAQDDKRYHHLSRALIQVPEHTWGLDEKTYLDDYANYSPAQLRAVRAQPNFQYFASSWREQRGYIADALAALGDSPEASEAQATFECLNPRRPETADFQVLADKDAHFETQHFTLGFDAQLGSINYLKEKTTGRTWASPEHPLALFCYELFSQAEYDRFYEQYIINKTETAGWALKDFTKPGIEHLVKAYQKWYPTLTTLYQRQDALGDHFLLEMSMPQESWQLYGAPRFLTLELDLPYNEPAIHITVQWFEKQANRLPEACWLSFSPSGTADGLWSMDKIGTQISPLEVVSHGNRTLHAVDWGISYQDQYGAFLLETLDAPLIAPGSPSLLNFHNRQPQMQQGIHFNLFNNVWGTNFPMWYEEDARFRFTLRLQHEPPPVL